MSAFGILGSLAQGYTDAAKQRRQENLALGEHQRDLQISLLDKLLADPSTPEEYKGTLLQQRIATTNANQYDKNGQLKLPSLDDMRQQLPPVQRPATPGPGPAPAIQLPSAPPGMAAAAPESPSGASAPPSAALPPSGVQNAPGGPSVPPMLQMPTAPPMLPSVPIATPQPPPIAEAGQFHPLSHEEQQQRAIALARQHADALIAQGVDPHQAYVTAGLAPKPELHNIPFLGTAINPYTGQTFGAGADAERPHGQLQNFQTPNGIVSLQQVQTGDGKFHWVDGAGNAVVPDASWTKLVPSMLPTQRTSTTSDEYGIKSTTTGTTQKVAPGAKPTAPKITTPSAPPASGSATGGTTTMTPTEKRLAAKNAAALQLAADKAITIPTTATRNMAEKAPKVIDLAQHIRDLLNGDKTKGTKGIEVGPGESRWREFWAGKVGTDDPDFTRLRTNVSLLQTLLLNMHVGARGGKDLLDKFRGLIDSGKQSKENMNAALDEIERYAQGVQDIGSVKKPSAPPSGKSAEDEANEYLKSIGQGH